MKPNGPRAHRRPQEGRDADDPRAQPHGTTADQVANMDAEGAAQPQADERDDPDTVQTPGSTHAGDRGGSS